MNQSPLLKNTVVPKMKTAISQQLKSIKTPEKMFEIEKER